MKHIRFYFDVISPYAYLAFEKLPEALVGVTHTVSYHPVLFAGMLAHHGQLGPAEIEPKRHWTYRQVQWLAHRAGVPLALPATHPFNPLGLQRLATACAVDGRPGRHVVETLFHHVWRSGLEASDPQRLQSLTEQLQPARDPGSDAVKAQLRQSTEAALAAGVFGVPTMAVDGKLFWGLDALPMLRDHLLGDPWFDGPAWQQSADLVGVQRPR